MLCWLLLLIEKRSDYNTDFKYSIFNNKYMKSVLKIKSIKYDAVEIMFSN